MGQWRLSSPIAASRVAGECSQVLRHLTVIPAAKRFSYGRGWVRTSVRGQIANRKKPGLLAVFELPARLIDFDLAEIARGLA